MRALLVEDEALVALIAEEALSGFGFRVTVAGSGAEARRAFAEGGLDLAVIDVGLPDIKGYDLAGELRSQAPDLPILMASGYDAGDVAARFPDDTRVRALGKPYTEGDLAEAIRSLGLQIQG
ncbi:response regulator [Brevundimonas sp.]|uniref:response regulator n=1 Tax=Brevundimonas sp. TaxID=1871086 RepID=UPI0025D8135B|nr:response regulator [Brevundimonas sp.]